MSHGKSICRTVSGSSCRSENGFALRRRVIATCVTLVSLAGSLSVQAADLSVMVVDRDGRGVGETVVTAAPAAANLGPLPVLKPAVMDQRNLAFMPRVLVVGVGGSVEFPNNDSVSHQVYSFSAAKRFQLPLYKGEVHPPVTFDRAGLVVLGCNIHDAMVGYIYVTDARYFGKTEAGGDLQLKGLPAGDYRIGIWSPFIADAPAALIRTVHVDDKEAATTRVQLSLALRAQPEPRPRRRDWEY
jgi:plastocyanin